jgi:hypothetical protein
MQRAISRQAFAVTSAAAASSSPASSSSQATQVRHTVGSYNHLPTSHSRRHNHKTLPMDDANRFGGRSASLREPGKFDHKKRGARWKLDPELQQYNIDVWCAQQTLRKKWKARDWEVVELPFEHAPAALQQVIPELHTELPTMAAPAAGDYGNVRAKVYDREELQDVLFPRTETKPYPALRRVDKSAATLDSFFGQ